MIPNLVLFVFFYPDARMPGCQENDKNSDSELVLKRLSLSGKIPSQSVLFTSPKKKSNAFMGGHLPKGQNRGMILTGASLHGPVSSVGFSAFFSCPRPSWPEEFRPQMYAFWSERRAIGTPKAKLLVL